MPQVNPTHSDPFLAQARERIGGPMGRFARNGYTLLPPLHILIIVAALTYTLGYFLDYSCMANGWQDPQRYMHLCYSDIPPLFVDRGFAEGIIPYLQTGSNGVYLEYPVITGVFMFVAAAITNVVIDFYPDGYRAFFDVNVVLLFIPFVITVIATALTTTDPGRAKDPWRAAMIVFAPTMILAATINWDLIPIALVSLALLAWSRSKPTLTGVFLGLAIAAKFYPVVILIAFVLWAWRSGQWRATITVIIAALMTFLAVNIPFAILNFEGWFHFYTFNFDRAIDFGSFWYAITLIGLPTVPESVLNIAATASFAVLLIGIAYVTKTARTPPSIYQIIFLVMAAFVITNKVYSPQYVLWLVPLAVLARPNWRDFMIWQVGEVVYFAAIWWFLAGYGVPESENFRSLPQEWYAAAVFVHIAATAYFAIMVLREIYTPDIYTPEGELKNTESNREVVNRTSAGT